MDGSKVRDVVVIGGGAAGLSAAVALGRSLRKVVVIDAGEPRNAPAAGAHNLLGREGIPPLELLAKGRREAEGYGAEILSDRAVAVRRTEGVFEVDLAGGGSVRGRRILLATGLVDVLPEVPGVREFWGDSVLHCPYCHGWEVRGRRIGILGTSPMSMHQTLLFRQLSEHVTLFMYTMDEPTPEELSQLDALGVQVVRGKVQRLAGEGTVHAVVMGDGRQFELDAVAVAPRFQARSDLFEQLGGTVTEHPMGSMIETDQMSRTKVDGVWAAGNASVLNAMVGASAAAGVFAGAAINADLAMEDAKAAVLVRTTGSGALV
jgi:thioredoxin reductase